MRRLVFRGKTLKQHGMLQAGSWVQGGYYMDDCYGGCPEGKHYIMCWNSTGLSYYEGIEVERETVGQFTGLKDKNGKWIWEGDLVHADDPGEPGTGTITFADGCFWIHFGGLDIYLINAYEEDELEVIGNIYDNQ